MAIACIMLTIFTNQIQHFKQKTPPYILIRTWSVTTARHYFTGSGISHEKTSRNFSLPWLTTALQPRIRYRISLVKRQGDVWRIRVMEECQVGAPERQFVRVCEEESICIGRAL